jgi:shikimate dehydrogenase
MHMAGYRHLGMDATYELLETAPDGFPAIVAALRNGTLNGVNVTMPHKRNAFAAMDTVDDRVRRLGAVNTITVTAGVLTGFNTDVDGVLHALSRLDLPLDTPIHVLGSGGAAAAAIVATHEGRLVSLSARSEQRAGELRRHLRAGAAVVPWNAEPQGAIVVNATPLGMHGEVLPAGILASAVGLVDMAYGDEPTPAVVEAERRGIPYADGLVMLAGQAAEAFHLFTGHRVAPDVMESAARKA